jgi:radical SAM protein with 4Fe4S-binding SPASM domain
VHKKETFGWERAANTSRIAYGEIYPCHQFVGLPEYYMERALAEFNKEIQERFAIYGIKKEHCKDCFANIIAAEDVLPHL